MHDQGVKSSGLDLTLSQEKITFRIDLEKRLALDAIAAGMDRDHSDLINEARTLYLEMHQWQIAEIQQAVAEADAEDFATEDEVNIVFARLTHGKAG